MINYKGLRKRQTYDELVDFIERDPVRIHYPDRRATEMRESPYLTQLDGEGMRQMESLELNKMKEQQKQHALLQMAQQTGHSVAHLAVTQTPSPNTAFFNMFGDEPLEPPDSDESDGSDDDGPNLGPALATQDPPAMVVPQAPATPPPPAAVQALAAPHTPVDPVFAGAQPDAADGMLAQAQASFATERELLQNQIASMTSASAAHAAEQQVLAETMIKTHEIEQDNLRKHLASVSKKLQDAKK